MKKFAAILLSVLFLFNLAGYRFVFNYLQQQSDVKLQASFDRNDYNEAELITIKVPISLPYVNNQSNFERVDGEITVEGKIYKYVKRKISDGNLVLLCLPDYNKMRLQSEKTEYFKYANDLAQNDHSKKSDNSKSGFFKNQLSEFYSDVADILFLNTDDGISNTSGYSVGNFPTAPHISPEQPPES